ncbi:hypothetical protein SDC9_46358 [bioreactor metagenome]|uniref:Type 4 fimbrial biogenesis protein PilX N-terminal domain-containing protein n=1 Tax=bioreactor metagenome TaxID=1076179 RepID=A0A644W8H8_9ZZZZ
MTARDSSPIGVGVITVFMILIVLCLSTFAALTYVSARADYRLSRINADTVAAYYEADARAAKLAAEFAAGSAAELEQTIAMTDTQALYLHLSRKDDGSVAVLAWRTVALADSGGWGSDPLPVWGG